jgi:hypothetical protein
MAASVMAWSEKILAEGLVGRDEQGSAFIAGGDQLEQHTGLGLILGDVGDIVEDQQLVLVELGDGGFEPQLPARHLQSLDEVGGAHEQHAPAILNERMQGRKVTFQPIGLFCPLCYHSCRRTHPGGDK